MRKFGKFLAFGAAAVFSAFAAGAAATISATETTAEEAPTAELTETSNTAAEFTEEAATTEIALDGDKFTADGLSVNLAYVQVRKKSAAAVGVGTAQEAKSPKIAGTLRIGLGGADFAKAEKFRFLLKSDSAARLKFGFIDTSGTAYIVKKTFDSSLTTADITYYNYSMTAQRATAGADLDYTGLRFNEAGKWGASYVEISKSAFVNALSYKTGNGVAFGYGYSEGSETDEIDWSSIDSVFMEMVNYASYQSNVNFYSMSAVSGENIAEKATDAANLREIGKPAYRAGESGYAKNDYSFGTRPALENEDLSVYFDDCVYEPKSYTLAGGKEVGVWASDGTAQNLTACNAISYYVDNTVDGATTGATDWEFTVKAADDKNYYGAGAGIRIPDDGNARFFASDVQKIPAGFRGRIVIPFTSFKDGANLLTSTDLAGVKRTLVMLRTNESGVSAGSSYKMILNDIKYIGNYNDYKTAAQKTAVSGAVTAFGESFSVTGGAALRVKKDDYGLRFKVNLSPEAYTALTAAAEETGVQTELGAILSATEALNGAALTKENARMSLTVGNWYEEGKSFFATLGYAQICGNENVSYTVRGYLTLTFANGETQTIYTEYTAAENGTLAAGGAAVRSLMQVAEAVNETENFEKEFSGKSEAGKAYAREVLEQILAAKNA